MLGLWDYGEGSGTGTQKPPAFEVVTTANHAGYRAEFEIRESKFWLSKLTGQIDGKTRKNEEIMPGERFPIVAEWFTGKIHLEIGEFDYEKQEANAVIIFDVNRGIITKTEFAARMKRVDSWNGLPQNRSKEAVK